MSYELHLGDCLEVMDGIPDQSIDAVICDPPYGATLLAWDRVLPFDKLWAHYRRVLKPTGCVVLFGTQPFTSALVMSNPGWFRYELVWNKNKCGSPGLAKIRPMKVHENILVFAPGRTTYNPQMEAGEPYRRAPAKRQRCNTHQYGFNGHRGVDNPGVRYPKSIVNISRDFSAQQQVHPTQKPVPLFEWLVRTFTNEGDTVLDNCAGIGPTGIACVNTGRRAILIESEAEYVEIARERLQRAVDARAARAAEPDALGVAA